MTKYEVSWDTVKPRNRRTYTVSADGVLFREFNTLDEALAYIDRAKVEDAWHAAGGWKGTR